MSTSSDSPTPKPSAKFSEFKERRFPLEQLLEEVKMEQQVGELGLNRMSQSDLDILLNNLNDPSDGTED